jgi:CheY-like chemotaxis protein
MKPNLSELISQEREPAMEVNFAKRPGAEHHLKAEGESDKAHAVVCHKSEDKPPARPTPPILLLSQDAELSRSLHQTAEHEGRAVVRVEETEAALRTLRAVRPVAVLLDLDMPAHATWEMADRLLQETNCPPVLLLTAGITRSGVQVAIQTGSIVDKSTNAARLLQILDQAVSSPH